jgi:hypothetical protein
MATLTGVRPLKEAWESFDPWAQDPGTKRKAMVNNINNFKELTLPRPAGTGRKADSTLTRDEFLKDKVNSLPG